MRALLLLLFAFALMGQRDPILVPEVSQHEVQVRQGFTGTELLLFGAVLDPQGRAVHHALDGLGFAGVEDVRIGRLIELTVADSTSDADLEAMCEKLLANTVIENYRIEKVGQ